LVVAAVLVLVLAAAAAYLIIHHKPKAPTGAPATTSVNESNAYSSPNFVMYPVNANTIIINNYGENITLRIPTGKIVAMNTVALQVLIDIGAGNHVVGVEGYATELPWLFGNYSNLPAVSSGMWSINYEEIVNLKPDIVITWSYILPQVRQKLQAFNIPAIAWGPTDNLTSFIYFLGLITNHTDKATHLINWLSGLKRELKTYQSQINQHPRAYIIFAWDYSPWFVAGNNSDPYRVAVLAGLQPCFNKSMQVQPESVLRCNPSVIIVTTWDLNPHSPNATTYCEGIINSVRNNLVLNQTAAVREGHIIVIPGYLTEGPPGYIAALYIDSVLWPNVVRVNATELLNQYFSEFLTTAEPGGTWFCSG
jgi:ABC-type Fe3+-hydroxamate transport system substrate-binding protein